LQRQVVHGEASLGQLKTASAAERLRDINPAVTVVEHPVRLSTENAHEILSQYDLVIDGADNFATRYLVNEVCVSLGIPDVLGSVLRFTGQVSVFWAKVGPCYACVFPQAPVSAPSCADAGVFGALCGTVGSWMATEAIKLLVGVGDPLIGRLLRYDAQLMKVTELTIEADESCPVCAQVSREEPQRPQAHVLAEVSVLQLQDLLSARSRGDAQFRLVDIREPHEFEICQIAGAELIPQAQFIDSLSNISRDDSIVVFCRSGVRSAHALRAMQELGFTHASHLAGGILNWIDRVEPHQTKY